MTDCPYCESDDTEQTANGPLKCNDCGLLFSKTPNGHAILGPSPDALPPRSRE